MPMLLALGVSGLGCKGSRSQDVTAKAGPFTLSTHLEPDPPQEKGNTLKLAVKDDGGKPIDGAEVSVLARMPAMGSMAEMRVTAKVSSEGQGRYQAAFDLGMTGTFTLEVTVKASQGSGIARYTFTVGSPGLSPMGASPGAKEPIGKMPPMEGQEDVITIEAPRRQKIGIRTGLVQKKPFQVTIRTVGRVTYDETRLVDVNLKIGGWISRLEANASGQMVRSNDVLFTLYSPSLVTTQDEYLLAMKTLSEVKSQEQQEAGSIGRARRLVESTRERLRLWGITEAQINQIPEQGEARIDMPIRSPATGYVIEKDVVEGASVESGKRLYRIASLDPIWIVAEIYESDLPLVKLGAKATISLSYFPGRSYEGAVTYLYPYLDPQTRTARVRIELPNPALELRPAMYANVELQAGLGERLMVPEEAVIYAGPRRLVFLDLGEGRLQPREVEVGIRSEGFQEVLRGLKDQDRVVSSGNFLVAAESRLRSATKYWEEEPDSKVKAPHEPK